MTRLLRHKRLSLFIFLTCVGVVLQMLKVSWVLSMTPFYILLSLLVIFDKKHIGSVRNIISIFVVGLIGFASEIIGVQTGLLYGNYEYGNVLGLKVFDVALLLLIMWVFIPVITLTLASYSKKNVPLIAALLAVLYDLFLEQFAVEVGLWTWNGPVPHKNYVTWFIITFITVYVLRVRKLPLVNKKVAFVVFWTHILFFLVTLLLY